MKVSHGVSLRTRITLALVAAVAVGLLALFFREDDAAQANTVIPPGGVQQATADTSPLPTPLSSTEPAFGQRSNLPDPPAVALEPARKPEVSRQPANDAHKRLAWDLVAQLEVLAQTPATFHARALPLIERLTQACADDARIERTDSEPASSVGGQELLDPELLEQELLEQVVLDAQRSPLVRGAVYLGLTPVLSESAFWNVFDLWFAAARTEPHELVRAAALAATRRGQPSPCTHPIALQQLAALPMTGGASVPGFYPLVLERIASEHACDSMRAWLDVEDPRRALFRRNSGPPDESVDLQAAGEYFVTAEVLFCVWGHQCLWKPTVERQVLREALMEGESKPTDSLVCFRAASFLVHALAMCSDSLLDAASRASSSSDPMVASIARTMEGSAVGGLGATLVTRIERLRYSAELNDEAELVLLLIDVGKNLRDIQSTDVEQHTTAIEYLGGIVMDPAVGENVRASALTAIVEGGTWADVMATARAVLMRGNDVLLTAIALNTLAEQARSNDPRRVEALELLRDLVDEVRDAATRQAIETTIAELAH